MYKILNSKEIFAHPRLTLIEDDIEYEDGTKSTYLKFKHTNNSVQVIGIRDDGKICMIEEYCHGTGENLLMFPGGLISLDEDKLEGAKREFGEEAGYTPNELEYLGMVYPYHRRLPEQLYLYVGRRLEQSNLARDDSEQAMKVLWFTEEEIDQKVASNSITNSHALAHWAMYKNKVQSVKPKDAV